jgi:hypothetical protein
VLVTGDAVLFAAAELAITVSGPSKFFHSINNIKERAAMAAIRR